MQFAEGERDPDSMTLVFGFPQISLISMSIDTAQCWSRVDRIADEMLFLLNFTMLLLLLLRLACRLYRKPFDWVSSEKWPGGYNDLKIRDKGAEIYEKCGYCANTHDSSCVYEILRDIAHKKCDDGGDYEKELRDLIGKVLTFEVLKSHVSTGTKLVE